MIDQFYRFAIGISIGKEPMQSNADDFMMLKNPLLERKKHLRLKIYRVRDLLLTGSTG